MKRMAILTGRDPSLKRDLDGASILLKGIAKRLGRSGHAIDIYTPIGYTGISREAGKIKEQAGKADSITGCKCTKIIRFPVPEIETPGHSREGLGLINRISISLAEAAYFNDHKLYDYDMVIILHMAHTFGLVLRGYTPIDRTVLFPMMLGEFYRQFTTVPQAYIDMEREVLNVMMHIQTPSKAELDVLRSRYGVQDEKIFVTPRGFDDRVLTARHRKAISGTAAVLCANTVKKQKGQKIFVQAARELEALNTSTVFHIAGNHENMHNSHYNMYAGEFAREAEESCSGKFVLHPPMFQERLNRLMLRCDIAAYPSVTETFGKSALESMATGLPTIVFNDVPAFSESIDDMETGLIVERDPRALAEAISRLANDSELYGRISRQGIEKGARYTWDNIVDAIMAELDKRIGVLNG